MSQLRKDNFANTWQNVLNQLKQSQNKVHLSLNIEAIENAVGVSANSTNGGLKTEEAI